MDVIASNLANADGTNGVGDAYHRKAVVMAEASGSGAERTRVQNALTLRRS
jgi:flagellar basal body rod protein FlgC